jgi:hypothetical protein
MRSLDLRTEPSIRQTETILRRIDQELTARGARVDRAGAVGGLRFKMPWPWHAPRLGILLAITSGRAVVSAGAGGPWRVRYSLDFSVLRAIVIGLSVVVIGARYAWPERFPMFQSLAILWLVVYGVPFFFASLRFRRIIQASAAEVVERRHGRRVADPERQGPPPHAKPDIDPPIENQGVRSTE